MRELSSMPDVVDTDDVAPIPAGTCRYATRETVTHSVNGSTTIDVKAFNPDGSLANETVSTTRRWRWK